MHGIREKNSDLEVYRRAPVLELDSEGREGRDMEAGAQRLRINWVKGSGVMKSVFLGRELARIKACVWGSESSVR